jgi:hypothetical protein
MILSPCLLREGTKYTDLGCIAVYFDHNPVHVFFLLIEARGTAWRSYIKPCVLRLSPSLSPTNLPPVFALLLGFSGPITVSFSNDSTALNV